MTAQTATFESDALGVLPTVLLLLVMILIALGVIAHVAFA